MPSSSSGRLLAAASTIAMALTASPGDNHAYFRPDTHAAPILLGAALAALFTTRGTVRSSGDVASSTPPR